MDSGKLKRIAASLPAGGGYAARALLSAVLEGIPGRPAGGGRRFTDGGYIMSLAGDSGAVRFFQALEYRRGPSPGAAPARLASARLRSFLRLCSGLNRRFGLGFDLRFAARMREALLFGGRDPGWPFFGAKLRPGGETVLTAYFTDAPWEPRLGWGNLALPLGLFGLKADGLRRLRPAGVFDCAGISLSSSGQKSLKIYTRFPAPGPEGLRVLAGPQGRGGLGFLKGCAAAGKVYPVRHWTNAYGFGPGGAPAGPVKTEAHFLAPAPAAALRRFFRGKSCALPGEAWDLLCANSCGVTTLAVQDRRVTAYFTA